MIYDKENIDSNNSYASVRPPSNVIYAIVKTMKNKLGCGVNS